MITARRRRRRGIIITGPRIIARRRRGIVDRRSLSAHRVVEPVMPA
jgi:hypothetical protein